MSILAPSDFEMYRETSKDFQVIATLNNAPVDITTADILMTAKRHSANTSNVFQLSVGQGIVKTDAINGEATITISPSHTASLPRETVTLVYDVVLRTAGGVVSTIAVGTITVYPNVTDTV